jgi:polycomb group RING finger protein 3
VTTLKKYVALKIFSNLDQYKELDICLDDEPLGKDHTLKFIQATNKKDKVILF